MILEVNPSRSYTKQAKGRYTGLKEQLDSCDNRDSWADINTMPPVSGKKYNFVDLFSGCGGLSQGFTKANFSKIFSIEIDPDASATIRKNWPQSYHFEGDISNLSNQELKEVVKNREIHMVVGGPPCNGFSVAGHRNPNDKRNYLYEEFLRIVKCFRPWVVVMENVPGIVTMDNGRFLEKINKKLKSYGYRVSVRILEAANFCVPQLRARAIFIANRFSVKNLYPKIILAKEEFIPIEDALSELSNYKRDASINHEWTRHSEKFMERISKVPPGGSLYKTFRDAYKRQYLGVPSMAIKENHGGTHIHPTLNRVISAREMARLQTFDDDFIFEGRMKRVMWQVGNAVPVKMAEHIAKAVRIQLKTIEKNILH